MCSYTRAHAHTPLYMHIQVYMKHSTVEERRTLAQEQRKAIEESIATLESLRLKIMHRLGLAGTQVHAHTLTCICIDRGTRRHTGNAGANTLTHKKYARMHTCNHRHRQRNGRRHSPRHTPTPHAH